jgi:hypothetical protein
MCPTHSRIIDAVEQGYSVNDVLALKRAHEQTIAAERAAQRAARATAFAGADPADGESSRPVVVVLDDVPDWERKSIRALVAKAPGEYQWLAGVVGEPADAGRVESLIAKWPEELANGSVELVMAVARQAERFGLWSCASEAWEKLAQRFHGPVRADHLARAAIDAGVAGESPRRGRLLTAAQAEHPAGVRARLELLDDHAEPEHQLVELAKLETDNKPLASLVAAHMARASMQIPDLDAAEGHLQEAARLEPDSIPVRTMQVNLQVQKARVAVYEDRDFSIDEAQRAARTALELRDSLISMRRFEESGRLLMLAADVYAAMRDPRSAARVLSAATENEIHAPDGAEVLGDAALRAGDHELALRVTGAVPVTDGIRRIRATARVDVGGSERREGLAELEAIALSDSAEAAHAAAARLAACLKPVLAPWHEEVATVLEQSRHKRFGVGLRLLALASRGRVLDAQQSAERMPHEAWVAELRLMLAGERGNHEQLRSAAAAFLAFGPGSPGQVLAAKSYAKAGDLGRAAEILTLVTQNPNAPPVVRSDAFALLMRTLADRDLWHEAVSTYARWEAFVRSDLPHFDDRLSAWQVRIAHRKRLDAKGGS